MPSSPGNPDSKACGGPHGLRPPPGALLQCPAENLGSGSGSVLAKRGRKVCLKTKAKATAATDKPALPGKKTSPKVKVEGKTKPSPVPLTAYERKKEYCKERYNLLREADCYPQQSYRGELTPRQSFIRQRLRTLIDEHKQAQGGQGPAPSAKTFWARVTSEWHASVKAEKLRLEEFDREVLAEEPQAQPPPVAVVAAAESVVEAAPIMQAPVTSLGGSSVSTDKPSATVAPSPRGQGGLRLRGRMRGAGSPPSKIPGPCRARMSAGQG